MLGGKFFDGLGKRGRFDFKRHRQGAHRRHDLRFAEKQDAARAIGRAVGFDRRHAADGADLAVRVDILAIDAGGVH